MISHTSSSFRSVAVALGFTLTGALLGACKKREVAVPPTPIQWNANATAYRTNIGMTLSVLCPPGGTPGSLWGTDVYTTDSSICTAGVHSGRIQLTTGGVFQIQINQGMPTYAGTIRGGVASRNYQAYPASFTIVGGPAPGLTAIPVPTIALNPSGVNIGGLQINVGTAAPASPWTANARATRGQMGVPVVFQCPPGGTLGSVWGSGTYTDDSSVCTAAVHAGRIQLAQGGTVTIFVKPGMSAYAGSPANGVVTRNFGTFAGSFSFDP